MATETARRHSRWMLRVLEWSDPKARYPNLWHEGMPVHVLAFDTVAGRLRLGDLIAVYHPAVQSGERKQGAFLGLSRVVGLRRSHNPEQCWIDLETAHRLEKPLVPARPPRRVFLCCDPEWPGPDVALFRELFDAAVADGWKPLAGDLEAPHPPAGPVRAEEPVHEPDVPVAPVQDGDRLFCGVQLGGGLRDRREDTWIAVVRLAGGEKPALDVVRLESTGRQGLAGLLRSPDHTLMSAEGTGLAFPFSLPVPFVESIHDGSYPDSGWWGLVRLVEKMPYPDFLEKVQRFHQDQGEGQRLTDRRRAAGSPLQRDQPDLACLTYHGMRILGEERSRYAVRPFESAEGRLLFEVRPALEVLDLDEQALLSGRWSSGLGDKLSRLPELPVTSGAEHLRTLGSSGPALKAVLAARQAVSAVLSGEVARSPEELDPEQADRIRKEGWIYG